MDGGIAIGFLSVLLIFGVLPLSVMYFLQRMHAKKMDTLLRVVELGGQVDPEMIKMLSSPSSGNHKLDYKYGLIFLAIGIPLAFGLFLENGFESGVFGSIPALIGVAFLISGKYRLREPS
jgi:uncharacterized membrane protein SpoIIM required for sporulation